MKKILAIVAAFSIVAFNGFMLLEGATSYATNYNYGPSTSTAGPCTWDVNVNVLPEIAMNCSASSTDLTPDILGMTGGSAYGDHTCRVFTNNVDGFKLEASSDSALTDGTDSFADADPSACVDAGGCFGVSFDAGANWTDFSGSPITVDDSVNDANMPAGTLETLHFGATVVPDSTLESGAYSTTISATASML